MKSLLDLQQEIRALENNISHVMECIQNINDDIDEMRNASQNMDVDYAKIKLLAKHISFGKHPIDKLNDGKACQMYLEMLLNIVHMDLCEETSINRLVFIQWIQMESGIDWSLEDLFKDCYKTKIESFHEFVNLVPVKYRESFIVDALIVAGLCGTANAEIYEYIAELVAVFGIDKDRLLTLSTVARVALCQNINCMEKKEMDNFQRCAKFFKHYIKSEILEIGIKSLREIIVEIPDSEARDFKWKVKQEQAVNKGDVVAIYGKVDHTRGYFLKTNYVTEEIKSPSTGTIYQFRDKCINYGVIAHETDNKDSIKAWVKARR